MWKMQHIVVEHALRIVSYTAGKKNIWQVGFFFLFFNIILVKYTYDNDIEC